MSKYVDAIIGHAIGDAMGVPTEFCSREKLLEKPVTKMLGYGSHHVPAGTWSDDTTMEIATIISYIENNKFNYSDIMSKWTEWINEGKYTATNETFDVGRTCLTAIRNYSNGINPLKCGLNDQYSNGNGSLMRILPVALYSYSKNLSNLEIIKLTNDISSLTHAHDISKLGCYIYVLFAIDLLKGLTKEEAYNHIKNEDYTSYSKEAIDKYSRLLNNDISKLKLNDIKSSGYVVDTLECAIWILLNTNNYQDSIISSTNIGEDTDTVGAVLGGLSGILYGIDSIPKEWLNTLIKKDYLIELATNYEKLITL